MASYEGALRDVLFTFKDRYVYETTDAVNKYWTLANTPIVKADPGIDAGIVRISALVYANRDGIFDESYVWRLEGVYDYSKQQYPYYSAIGTPSVTLIAGPGSPVCTVSMAPSGEFLRYSYHGETSKTYRWLIDTELTLFRKPSQGKGGPPGRVSIQISSGMDVGEAWAGMTEGIHTLVPDSTYFYDAPSGYMCKEEWKFENPVNNDYLEFKAARYGYTTGTPYCNTRYYFYWTARSAFYDSTVYGTFGSPPTFQNGFLRDFVLDRVLVVGSGPTEVTFSWERYGDDPTDIWGNY